MVALLLLAFVVTIAWLGLAFYSLRAARHSRRLKPSALQKDDSPPPLDVIIPARNEDKWIAQTLKSLQAQDYPHLAIIIVDDQSTDQTASVVQESAAQAPPNSPPIRLLSGTDRPDGWVGKTWALHQGIEASTSDWICMIDADVILHPQTLSTAWSEARRVGADMISLLGQPRCRTFWQASIGLALVHILYMLYPLREVNRVAGSVAVAHGAFMMIRRDIYRAIGGIKQVKAEIVEDIQFAQLVKSNGYRLQASPAPDLLQTHMYGSLMAIREGLRKNAFAGMQYRLHKFIFGSITGLIMAWMPLVAIMIGLLGLVTGQGDQASSWSLIGIGLVGSLAQAISTSPVIVFLSIPPWYAFALPIGLSIYIAITTESVLLYFQGRVLWKGRSYDRKIVENREAR